VKLLSVEPPYDPKLEEVRDGIRTKLAAERREKGMEAFLSGIWKGADVRIDEEALKQLKAPQAGAAKK
jgi:hypothetical protein